MFTAPGGAGIDTIVLACTHFPLVEAELAAAAPRPVAFVDGKEGIARRTAFLTRHRAWPDEPPVDRALFTGRTADLDTLSATFAKFGIDRLDYL
jgi:glutamate racemase